MQFTRRHLPSVTLRLRLGLTIDACQSGTAACPMGNPSIPDGQSFDSCWFPVAVARRQLGSHSITRASTRRTCPQRVGGPRQYRRHTFRRWPGLDHRRQPQVTLPPRVVHRSQPDQQLLVLWISEIASARQWATTAPAMGAAPAATGSTRDAIAAPTRSPTAAATSRCDTPHPASRSTTDWSISGPSSMGSENSTTG